MNFQRPFADIWRFTPFGPSHGVDEFLARFTVDGSFEAERFWEYVTLRLQKRPAQRATGRAPKAKPKVI